MRNDSNAWRDEYNSFMSTQTEWNAHKSTNKVAECPATEKQIKFLKVLGIMRKDIPYTKRECRELISTTLDMQAVARGIQGDDYEELEALGLSFSDLH